MFSKLHPRFFLIVLGVIVILAVAGYAYYNKMIPIPAQASSTSLLATPQNLTAVVQPGDLTVYAKGTGMLIAHQEIQLGFGTGGPISVLNVHVGDKVHKGDVLAVQGNQDALKAAVATDQIAVMDATTAIQAIKDAYPVAAAQAQLDLANATAALKTAEQQLFFQQPGNRASSLTIDMAKAAVAQAGQSMNQAEAAYKALSGRPLTDSDRVTALGNLIKARQKYYMAVGNLNWYTGKPTANQQAQLEAAVALAQANLAKAQNSWDTVKNGPDANKLALAELQLAHAKDHLAISNKNLEASTIVAPTAGTILSVTARVGDDVSAPFIVMADLSQRYLTITLDATNLDKMAVNHKVEVIFDALPNQIFSGLVIQIDPNLYAPTGEKIISPKPGQVTMVKGLVSLDENTMTSTNNLVLGMTATVNVIGGQAKNVVLVPIEALHKQSPGKYAVYVIENNTPVLRPVEVGLTDSTYAEIKSGLKVGDKVVTGMISAK